MLHSSPIFRLIGLPLICVALFAMMGGHWTLLQGTAWGKMLVTYSAQSGSFAEGIKQTFNGKNRCSLCEQVAEGRSQEKKDQPESTSPEKNVGFAQVETHEEEATVRPSWITYYYPPVRSDSCPLRTTAPSEPVPIA